jgi:hypothetical protein
MSTNRILPEFQSLLLSHPQKCNLMLPITTSNVVLRREIQRHNFLKRGRINLSYLPGYFRKMERETKV